MVRQQAWHINNGFYSKVYNQNVFFFFLALGLLPKSARTGHRVVKLDHPHWGRF